MRRLLLTTLVAVLCAQTAGAAPEPVLRIIFESRSRSER
jgi:hypothetical protein